MTISLELSKQLYEKGLKIGTEKWWVKSSEPEWLPIGEFGLCDKEHTDIKNWHCYPAPSTDELLTVMPAYINGQQAELKISKDSCGNYWCQYLLDEGNDVVGFSDKSLPEALGLMVKWLLENGYRYDSPNKLLVKGEI